MEIQAHRGDRSRWPENTLAAFAGAAEAGAHSIETDLQITADGQVVLYHDDRLDPRRVAAVSREGEDAIRNRAAIRALAMDVIRGLRVRHGPEAPCDRRHDGHAIPTLPDLLAFARTESARQVVFDLEVKSQPSWDGGDFRVVRDIVAAIASAGLIERCRIRSFDHRLVREAAAFEPRLARGILLVGFPAIDPVELVRAAGAGYYCPEIRFVDRDLTRRCGEFGVRVLPWTANTPEDWARLIALGVDGITTDDPAGLATFLRGRGR